MKLRLSPRWVMVLGCFLSLGLSWRVASHFQSYVQAKTRLHAERWVSHVKAETHLPLRTSVVNFFQTENLDGYGVTVSKGAEAWYSEGLSGRPSRRWRVQVPFQVQDQSLQLTVWPLKPSLRARLTRLPELLLCVGIIVSVLLGRLLRLSQLAHERAERLLGLHETLQAEMASRRRAETLRQTLEKALLKSQKLEAVGTLAGGMAHDFNNMLYAINGYVDLCLQDVESCHVAVRNLKQIKSVSEKGSALIQKLLSFGRQSEEGKYPCVLRELLRESWSLLQSRWPSEVAFFEEHQLQTEQVMASPVSLQQVFMNVLRNGLDAIEKTGRVCVKTQRLISQAAFREQFPHLTASSYLVVHITDTGAGMDEATCARIFEPFFTTKEVGRGTGLGLALSHAMIQDHAGEITVESVPGEGTTFSIYLPEYFETESEYGRTDSLG